MRIFILCLVSLLNLVAFSQKTDTVFLFQKPGQKIFIEPTKNIEQYKKLTDFHIDDTDNFHNFYRDSKESFKQRGLKFHKYNFGGFPKQWVTVKYYKDSFYAYDYCDFYFDYKLALTDSFFINDMEGAYAEEIFSYNKINDSTFSFLISNYDRKKQPQKITFFVFDRKRNIAVVETIRDGSKDYILMMDATKLIELPIIQNGCYEQKESEFDFDLPDYDKLTNGRIRLNTKQNEQAKKAAVQFFKWFYANEDSLNTYKIFYLAGKDSARNWKLDFKEINKYIRHLKSSNMVSDSFCNTFIKKMKWIDRMYKKNPNDSYKQEEYNNGLIIEFRDIDFLKKNLNKLIVARSSKHNNYTYLGLGISEQNQIGISLTKVKNKWLVYWVNGVIYSDQ